MSVLLFCNVDQDGKIVESVQGERAIPQKQYEYFFFLQDETDESLNLKLPGLRVIDGQLTY